MRNMTIVLTALLVAPVLATSAQASLIGDTVTATGSVFAVNPSPQSAVVVDPGVEFSGILWNIDLGANSVLANMTAGSSQNFGGTQTVVLSDLDWLPNPGILVGIDNLVVDRKTTSGGFFDVPAFTDDTVTFRFQGTWGVGSFASFDLVTEHEEPVVPEPSTFLIWALGLLGLGWLGWRRRK